MEHNSSLSLLQYIGGINFAIVRCQNRWVLVSSGAFFLRLPTTCLIKLLFYRYWSSFNAYDCNAEETKRQFNILGISNWIKITNNKLISHLVKKKNECDIMKWEKLSRYNSKVKLNCVVTFKYTNTVDNVKKCKGKIKTDYMWSRMKRMPCAQIRLHGQCSVRILKQLVLENSGYSEPDNMSDFRTIFLQKNLQM